LLRLDIAVGLPIREEGSLHVLLDTRLRLNSILIKLPPVVVFGVSQILLVLHHLVNPFLLLLVALVSELLLLLKITDALGSPLLFLAQLDYPVLNLVLLVFHLLGLDDCVHHVILRLLRVN